MQRLVDRFRRDARGTAMVEYALLVGLIAVIGVGTIGLLGTDISTLFSNLASELTVI